MVPASVAVEYGGPVGIYFDEACPEPAEGLSLNFSSLRFAPLRPTGCAGHTSYPDYLDGAPRVALRKAKSEVWWAMRV